MAYLFCLFFFFSSRRRHTRFSRDWSSDVCSSDLHPAPPLPDRTPLWGDVVRRSDVEAAAPGDHQGRGRPPSRPRAQERSEERRVGKECRSRWARHNQKKKKDTQQITDESHCETLM